MSIKLTPRVEKAILLTFILSSLLSFSLYFDVYSVRSYIPSRSNEFGQNGTSVINEHHYSLLFKAEKPLNFKENDVKFLETDFFDLLNEVPMRDSNILVGITNRGNSCYADSVIQMLFRIPAVRKIVANLDIYHSRAKLLDAIDSKIQLEDIFKGLKVLEGLNHMFYQLQTNKTLDATFEFENSIQCLPGKFVENRQEDADEYFAFIMVTLKEIVPESQHHHFLLSISFNGIHRNRDNPSKSETKIQTDIETRISLPFNGKSDLMNLLDVYCAPETVDLEFEDKSPGILERSKKLESLPEIITIHLQRLSVDSNVPGNDIIRKGDIVDMPDHINFAKFLDPSRSSTSSNYRLRMFAVHSGNDKGGHYYAYYRNNDSSWCTLNDSRVTMNENQDKVKNDQELGYLYFYERIL